MNKYLFTLILMSYLLSGKAQDVSYYPFQSVFSVSTNPNLKFWADQRIQMNTFIGNTDFETHAFLNFKKKERVSYYSGIGLSYNFFKSFYELPFLNGYIFTVGSRINPMKNNRRCHINFEIAPFANLNFDGGVLRANLGLGYNFTSKKKQ